MLLQRALGAVVVLSVCAQIVVAVASVQAQDDPRSFPQTGYRIDDDAFWDYFSHRGGPHTFGYPVSRSFALEGFQLQIFQRQILQKNQDGSVGALNMLDPGLMPYTRINFSQLPAPDEVLKSATPASDEPNYDTRIVEFVRQHAPDTWMGLPVNFGSTFFRTVTCADAYPTGDCPENLLPLLNLELWGAPISTPDFDPNNSSFVYQRFQRGIMHYDAGCGCTQGLLLADYFKSILTGQGLPADLAQQAAASKFLRQYSPAATGWVARPGLIPASDLTQAFEPQAVVSPEASELTTIPADSAYRAASPEYGLVVHVFGEPTAERDLGLVAAAKFGWVTVEMPWRAMEPRNDSFDWAEADRIVDFANRLDLKIIAQIVGTPAWARADGAVFADGVTDGPPDDNAQFADFINTFVGRFDRDDRRIHAVEVWNEPNVAHAWGATPNPADYTQMLRQAYVSAKLASPRVTVLTGALTPTSASGDGSIPDDQFLQGMYASGAGGFFDVVAARGAGSKAAPEASPDQVAADPNYGGQRFFAFRHAEDIRGIMVANGDEAKQIWITEFGWTSDQIHPEYAWHAVSEDEKADYLVRAFQYAHANWTPWIGVMTAWSVAAPYWTPDNEQYWWAVTNPDGTTRPAYDRLAQARATGMLP